VIGLHVIGDPPELYDLIATQPPASILYLNPKEVIPYFAPITIGRIHYEPGTQDALLTNPVEGGRKVARDCIDSASRNGITIWQGLNEICVDNRDWADRYNAFERARVEVLEDAGLLAGLYSWSVGWPKEDMSRGNLYPEWYAPLMDWVSHDHYVIFHQYWNEKGPLDAWAYDPLRPSKVNRQIYWPWPHRILITECGIDITGDEDNGWKSRVPPGLNLEQWADVYDTQLQDFDALVSDERVVAKTVFMFGQGPWSHTFGIETHWRQFDCLVTDPAPTPPVEPMIRVLMESGVVVTMPVEEYLRGVVPAEMPALWPMEALKAQAVAARTYAMHAIENPAHDNADICTTTHCQVYDPTMIHDRSDLAIEETAGVVILYDGEIIQAFYSANCGGLTRSNREVWGGDHLPYLEPVQCVNQGPKNGHGVGMCQWGAHDMAEYGASYQNILKTYYCDVTLSNEEPPELPPGGDDMIDPRLSEYTVGQDGKVTGVRMEVMDAQAFISKWNEFALKAGDPYFKLVHAQFLDENQAQGNTGIHIAIQDENGGSMPGQVWHGYPITRMGNSNWVGAFDNGGQGAGDVFSYPSGQGEISQGEGNFAPESPDDLGPYLVAVYTDPGCGSIASECAYGFGLPHNRHVAYALTFRICPWGDAAPDPGPDPDPDPDPDPIPVPPVPAPGVPADLTGAFAVLSASILFGTGHLSEAGYLQIIGLALEEWED